VTRDFLLLVFFTGQFRIFTKIRGDIRGSRCTTGINDTGANVATNLLSVVDTGGKFTTGFIDIGSKFATGIKDTAGKYDNNIRLQTP
jgi:hypothetical protein